MYMYIYMYIYIVTKLILKCIVLWRLIGLHWNWSFTRDCLFCCVWSALKPASLVGPLFSQSVGNVWFIPMTFGHYCSRTNAHDSSAEYSALFCFNCIRLLLAKGDQITAMYACSSVCTWFTEDLKLLKPYP